MSNNPLKALAGQTVIYGLGTMIPRLLNYFLTPLYVRVFVSGVYGQITDLYAWMALLIALLTYGMETTFFRYTQKADSDKVFNNIMSCIFTTTAVFLVLYCLIYKHFAGWIEYDHNTQYVLFLGIIVALDALTAVPFAKLRKENKAKRFTMIKIANVVFNIGLNLFFLLAIPEKSEAISAKIFGPEAGLLIWVLISNVLASLLSLLLLVPQMKGFRFELNMNLVKPMLKYALPIMLVSIIGMVNEVADKILIKYLTPVPDEETLLSLGMTAREYAIAQVGIYGANYKLAVLMTIFIQMFRYASEPFFFNRAKDRNAPELYAKVMTYFVAFCLLIFLGVMLYIDVLKYFSGTEGSDYHEGLVIVPIILIANMLLGVVFNLGIWYKLTDKTICGTVITIIGASMTLLTLFVLVPRIGYKGAAFAHLACYSVMTIVSYLWGQKHFPIPYQIGRIAMYSVLAIILYFASMLFIDLSLVIRLTINTLLILTYIGTVIFFERKNPLKI